jgi:hypothetical protein
MAPLSLPLFSAVIFAEFNFIPNVPEWRAPDCLKISWRAAYEFSRAGLAASEHDYLSRD